MLHIWLHWHRFSQIKFCSIQIFNRDIQEFLCPVDGIRPQYKPIWLVLIDYKGNFSVELL